MSDADTRPDVASLADDAPTGLALLDRGFRFTYANRAFAGIAGLSVDRLLGRPIGEVMTGFPELAAAARRTMETGVAGPPLSLRTRLIAGGSDRPRDWLVGLRCVTAGGEPTGLGIVAVDVTEATRLRSEAYLQAERSRILAEFLARVARAGDDEAQVIRLLATHAADAGGGACAIFLVSEDGERAEVAAYEDVDSARLKAGRPLARAAFALAGSSLETVVRTGTPLLLPDVAGTDAESGPPEWHAFRKRFPLLSLASTPVCSGPKIIGAITVYRYETARAAFDEADVRFFQMLADGAAVIIDVGRARRAQADTARRMALIVDESPLATILVDREFRVQAWNRAAEEMFGWTEAEVLGKPIAIEPPDLKDEIHELRRRILEGAGIAGLETRRRRRDGAEIGVAIYEAPLRDAQGEITGAVLLLANTLERRRLEEELVQARKMETVGRLAGGVAHDFNNILTVLLGYSSLLAAEANDPEAVRRDALLIGDVVRRAGGLTQQLLAFSRRQESKVSVLDANETVLGMKPLILRLVGESVEVVVSIENKAVRLEADPTQLQQVLLNLAANARDAMPSGGRLIIRTGVAHFDRTSLSRHFEMPAGDYATISVTDTGTGMDEQTRSRLFEPFFTTKAEGKGTGLGLATSYNIVKQSGGHISVYSEPGHGTTFRLYFPAVDAPVQNEGHEKARARRRGGRVLLVEDEDELRELTHRLLADAGFDVVVAASPADALSSGRKAAVAQVDLLISDMIMPGMSGTELAGQLRAARPDLPVLLVSGHTEEIVAATNSTRTGFLAKPFTPDELLLAVDAVLAGGRTRKAVAD